MSILGLSFKNILHKPLSTSLSVLLMTLGVALVSLVFKLSGQVEQQFMNNIKGVDMVLGAKGSPLQLVLSSLYHIDAPTGNISKAEAEKALRHPMVESKIPLAYGDNYKGYRILGTDTAYLSLYDAEISEGKVFEKDFEVVLGATAAERLGLGLGSHFHGNHGVDSKDDEHVHDEHAYHVVGILEPSGTVVDQLIIGNIESVWQMHHSEDPKEYTAMLVTFKSAMGQMMIPRMINEKTSFQAALPSIEINRLLTLMGVGIQTLQLMAFFIIAIAGISVFISLLNALKERKYELALMRTMGASKWQVAFLLLSEALLSSIIAYALGLILSRGLLALVSGFSQESFKYNLADYSFMPEELYLLAFALGIALIAACVPAYMAFKLNISKTLSED